MRGLALLISTAAVVGFVSTATAGDFGVHNFGFCVKSGGQAGNNNGGAGSPPSLGPSAPTSDTSDPNFPGQGEGTGDLEKVPFSLISQCGPVGPS